MNWADGRRKRGIYLLERSIDDNGAILLVQNESLGPDGSKKNRSSGTEVYGKGGGEGGKKSRRVPSLSDVGELIS